MDSDSGAGQNIVVLRHGDRIDHFDPLWTKTAARPWDPPLILDGKVRAFSTGKKLNKDLGFPIHRVFVSPFLRCLQTASEVVHAICAVGDDSVTHTSSADGVVIDPTKLKVAVEYGLCEALNSEAIQPESAPKDGDFGFNISECEKLLPKGTVDSSVEPVYKELPKWEEPEDDARNRYKNTIKLLADKYPTENLLLVTHGDHNVPNFLNVCAKAEGVWVATTAYTPERLSVYAIDYCAYAVLQRTIVSTENEPIARAEFKLCTNQGHTGVSTRPKAQDVDDSVIEQYAVSM